MAMRDGLPQATTPAPLNPNAFADMVARHLKQMTTDRGAAADAGDGRVLLRRADATLPGTDLLLSRTPDGWVLRADVRSRRRFRSDEHTSELQSLICISYAVFCLKKQN